MMDQKPPEDWNIRSLKEYFERMFNERDKALNVGLIELNRRLDNLNHSHEQAKEKERTFYSREQHDSFANDMQRQFEQIKKDIVTLQRPQWSLWFPALALTLTVISGAWWFATQPLYLEIEHQKGRDNAIEEQVKAFNKTSEERSDNRAKASENRDATTNTRIDRLYELYRDLQAQHLEMLGKKK